MYRIVLWVFSSLFLHIESYKVEVKVKQGTIIGNAEETVFDGRRYYAFYGVPYAEAPIGKLRFKDPMPLKKWKIPFDARTEYRGACAQTHIVHKHGAYGFENCLHLNIYTPSLPNNRNTDSKPVVVWIHGYAFTSSFSHIHGADFLIDNDILFVSLTHRIGVFGFVKMNDTDSNANMGLKDIVMALKWIRKNIQSFGGDKDKITMMGSGSAATYLSLLLMTKTRKLFSKLILQSGSIFSPAMFQKDYNLEKKRLIKELTKIGINNLRKAPSRKILAASMKIYSSKETINIQRSLIPFLPIIEKKSNKSLLIQRPEDFYKNIGDTYLTIPIMVGFNSQESISEVIPFLHNPSLLKSLAAHFKFMVPFSDGCSYNDTSTIYGDVAAKIKLRYFNDGISEKSIENILKYASDLQKYPIYRFIKAHMNTRSSVMYMYKFNYNGKFNAMKATSTASANVRVKGASSGDEICYILKCEPLWESYVRVKDDVKDPDRIFIKEISQLWANFAKYGNPTPPSYKGNTTWPPLTSKGDTAMRISKVNKLTDNRIEESMYKYWGKIYDDYYSPQHCTENDHDEL